MVGRIVAASIVVLAMLVMAWMGAIGFLDDYLKLRQKREGRKNEGLVERYKQGATVTIRTKDGRTFSNTVYAPKGAGVRGIDWADVDAKYRTLVPRAQLSDRQVESSLQIIHDFHHITHVSILTDLLHAH